MRIWRAAVGTAAADASEPAASGAPWVVGATATATGVIREHSGHVAAIASTSAATRCARAGDATPSSAPAPAGIVRVGAGAASAGTPMPVRARISGLRWLQRASTALAISTAAAAPAVSTPIGAIRASAAASDG